MSNLRWDRMHKHEYYQTLHLGPNVVGWIVKLDGRWIARLADGSVRAEFDTMEEAQQFLTVIASAGESNE